MQCKLSHISINYTGTDTLFNVVTLLQMYCCILLAVYAKPIDTLVSVQMIAKISGMIQILTSGKRHYYPRLQYGHENSKYVVILDPCPQFT